MESLGHLLQGFAAALTPGYLLYALVGCMLGPLIGVLPGLGGANGVAILLPLTFSMNPTSAIIMLSCIYWGALFGGAITSILFNIPGEPWSVATTFDGYPMAQQGRAGEALGLRTTLLNFSQTAIPLVSGALGAAFGMAPVFWTMAAAPASSAGAGSARARRPSMSPASTTSSSGAAGAPRSATSAIAPQAAATRSQARSPAAWGSARTAASTGHTATSRPPATPTATVTGSP